MEITLEALTISLDFLALASQTEQINVREFIAILLDKKNIKRGDTPIGINTDFYY